MIAEEKLLDKHFHEWTPTFFDEESGYLMDSEPTVRIRENERYSDDIALTFRRGFVSSISLPCAAFMSHAKALFESQPIEEVRLVDREPDTTGNLWFCWARGNNMAERGDIPAPLFAFLPRHARLGDQSVVRKTRDESISDLSTACVAFGRQQAGLGQISPKRVEEDRVPRGVIYANPPDTPREVLTAQQEELAQAMRRAKRRKK